MIVLGNSSKPKHPRHRVLSHGLLPADAGSWVTGYMGREYKYVEPNATTPTPKPNQIFPMAYLVEQEPNTYLNPHFHVADQFQVFTAGTGKIGSENIEPISFHFVGKYSPYGPIEAAACGVNYFTLRNGFDPGSRFMPASRAELPKGRVFKQVFRGPIPAILPEQLKEMDKPLLTAVLEKEADGLCVWQFAVPSNVVFTGPPPSEGGGQHFLICSGDLLFNGECLGTNSCVFLSPEEEAIKAKAGPTGLYMLVFQYPRANHDGLPN